MKPPKNQKGVTEVLGLVGYYRKFISRFADAAKPMTKLTRKDTKFEWSDDFQSGFEFLKTCLTESPILKYPKPQVLSEYLPNEDIIASSVHHDLIVFWHYHFFEEFCRVARVYHTD